MEHSANQFSPIIVNKHLRLAATELWNITSSTLRNQQKGNSVFWFGYLWSCVLVRHTSTLLSTPPKQFLLICWVSTAGSWQEKLTNETSVPYQSQVWIKTETWEATKSQSSFVTILHITFYFHIWDRVAKTSTAILKPHIHLLCYMLT